MKLVNLLPDWYLEKKRERAATRRGIALLIALAAVGALEFHVLRQRNAREAAELLSARRQGLDILVGDFRPALASQQARIQRLQNMQAAFRDVGNTVPMSAVLQQIQNNLTPGMALSRAFIEVRQETVKQNGAAAVDPNAKPRLHDVAHFTVVGVAPNDVLIAQLIGKLSNNPIFSDISLNFTRTELVSDFSVRRFEIQMTIELDRLAAEQASPLQQASAREDQHAG